MSHETSPGSFTEAQPAASHKVIFDPTILQKASERLFRAKAYNDKIISPEESITDLHIHYLKRLAQGRSIPQIASERGVTETTITNALYGHKKEPSLTERFRVESIQTQSFSRCIKNVSPLERYYRMVTKIILKLSLIVKKRFLRRA